MERFNIEPLLTYIDPDESYTTWIQVGMALKHEGYPLSIWDTWSSRGQKYHAGECADKWSSFQEEAGDIVTGATITQMAKDRGWKPKDSTPMEFNAVLDANLAVIDPSYVDSEEVFEPTFEKWQPIDEIICYLKTLFHPEEHVGLVMSSFQDEDGKYKPRGAGNYTQTQRELIERLKKYKRIDQALGSYDKAGGAWVRINPLDGNGGKNSNVTDYRYTLIESDDMVKEKQLAIIKALQLPVAALVYSGGKSIHAIVHIDADTSREYKQRVERMYALCKKNGLNVDEQNKNPSRLSRLPGIERNGHKQFLIATNVGQPSYDAWIQWLQNQADDLPEFTNLSDVFTNPPPLAPELISGVLREGHKMLLSGPSKAGKSFMQIELAIAVAEGYNWLKFQCRQGKVLYINMEIDGASCIHRFIDVYRALGIEPRNLDNIDIWNLRGDAMPMDKLAPIIVNRARDHGFKLIIVDPLYKVLTGDENSAGDMSKLCNCFDFVSRETRCAVCYCHHHSKGAQGNKKAMDRASGSGVFARDPDAMLDITPLSMTEEADGAPANGYRVSGILREFKPFKPFSITFEYPIHKVDTTGILDMAAEEGSVPDLQRKGRVAQTSRKEFRQLQIKQRITKALNAGEEITAAMLSEEFGCTTRTIKSDIAEINEKFGVKFLGTPKSGVIYEGIP